MAWPVRSLYWLSITTGAVLVGFLVRSVVVAWLGNGKPLIFDAAATLLMTFIFAPMVWGLRRTVDIMSGVPPVQLLDVAINTFLIAGLFFVTRRHTVATENGTYLSPRQEVAAMPLQQPRLQRRLSEETTGTIIRLSSRDHHVDVVTTEGQETLRMRLIDAIDEMEPVEGYCTHRSHWVTREAIVEVEREKPGKIFLVLVNGDRVPVSRKYKPDLEAAGILD
ncbi:LytTR family DNA-binding domain-containing protein [uncultured Roseovarius sp.]|uniref:LytTR family DNA-binding domain-containing protein n=1 Tax=uncultured Roseovarius sp. TaxID=293344 RepID=UPI0025F6CD0B|nr:LytTR family DNA-binding domain-containing protein [uncultured Roseovarius sp.]